MARTILLFHIISARPSKQPRMVRTFLKVYMELGSYFLFLQEQIKDIIIIGWPLLRRNHEGPEINFFQICFLFSGPHTWGGHSGCGFLKILERKKRFIFFVFGSAHAGGGLRCCGFFSRILSH